MAKQTARDWAFQIRDVDNVTWLTLTEVNDFELDPSANGEITETTVFSSAGNYEAQKMQTGRTLKVSGFADYNSSGVQAAGQARCEVMHSQYGPASLAKIRMRHTTQTLWTVWDALVELGAQGGGNNAMNKWEVTFTKSGVATTM